MKGTHEVDQSKQCKRTITTTRRKWNFPSQNVKQSEATPPHLPADTWNEWDDDSPTIQMPISELPDFKRETE